MKAQRRKLKLKVTRAKPPQIDGRIRRIIKGDCLHFLKKMMASNSVDLVYAEPPKSKDCNPEKNHTSRHLVRNATKNANRRGFNGRRYRADHIPSLGFNDVLDDYLWFLKPRLDEIHRVLKPYGSLLFQVGWEDVHYCKVLLDTIFGRECFKNEIIWAYDQGVRSKDRWSPKHSTILWYSMHPKIYTFNYDSTDRLPYMAPNLSTPERTARGKTPTDVFWSRLIPALKQHHTGYIGERPVGLVERFVRVHSNQGDLVMDPFAGSGVLGTVADNLKRNFILIDKNTKSCMIMRKRLTMRG